MDLRRTGGLWPATLTPFTEKGDVDETALRAHLLEVGLVPGVKAVVVNGHAGEMTSLSREERTAIVRTARVTLPPHVGVVAGVQSEDTTVACNLADDARDAGADAMLLFPPCIFANGANLRPEMAFRFVETIADKSRLPIVVFQLSMASGLGYSTEILVRLCREIDSVIAVKEGGDAPRIFETNIRAIREIRRSITILTTNNTWLMPSLSLGVDGILSGMGSVAAPLLVALFEAVRLGDSTTARMINDRLFPLVEAFYRPPQVDAHNRMKTALCLLGRLPNAVVRPPLLPLPQSDVAAVRAALELAGISRNGASFDIHPLENN
jgi:4-hydroxy-tetrahydrodipicolinate synthase